MGVRWLLRHRLLRALVATGADIAFVDSAWFAIFVLFSRDRLDLGSVGFGALLATGAAGGLAGAVFADRAVRGHRHRAVVGWSMAVTAGLPPLLLVAERLSPTFPALASRCREPASLMTNSGGSRPSYAGSS